MGGSRDFAAVFGFWIFFDPHDTLWVAVDSTLPSCRHIDWIQQNLLISASGSGQLMN